MGWLNKESKGKKKDAEGTENSMSNDAAARWPDLKKGGNHSTENFHTTLEAKCRLIMTSFWRSYADVVSSTKDNEKEANNVFF